MAGGPGRQRGAAGTAGSEPGPGPERRGRPGGGGRPRAPRCAAAAGCLRWLARPWNGATVVQATALNRRKQTGDSVISAGSGGAGRKGESGRGERGSRSPAPRFTHAPASREGAGISPVPPPPSGSSGSRPCARGTGDKRPPRCPSRAGRVERAAPNAPRRTGAAPSRGGAATPPPRPPRSTAPPGGAPVQRRPGQARSAPAAAPHLSAGGGRRVRHVQATHSRCLRRGLKVGDDAAVGSEGFSLFFPILVSLKEKRRPFCFVLFFISPPEGTAGSGAKNGAVLLAERALWWGPPSSMI